MVDPETVIEPYDVHIDAYSKQVAKNWSETALHRLGINEYDILILYRGGCPDSYVPMLQPILGNQNIGISKLRPFFKEHGINWSEEKSGD